MTDKPIHPATAAILRYFEYKHLPEHLQPVSRQFFDMAHRFAKAFDGPELTAGLRKLLEAKDCFVRAAVEQRRAADWATLCHEWLKRNTDCGPDCVSRPASDQMRTAERGGGD